MENKEIYEQIQLKIINENTVTGVLNKRCQYCGDDPMIVSRPNLFSAPFTPKPNKNFPSPYLSVSFSEFTNLAKSCAYVINKKYNIQPYSRVGIIGEARPIHHLLLTYAVWYLKGTTVEISTGVGEEVVQEWMKTTDVSITFYDSALPSFQSFKDIKYKEKSEWTWTWENEGSTKSMKMINIESDILNVEIMAAYKSKNKHEEIVDPEDIMSIIGTSSSTQAIVKDGMHTTMKFVPCKNGVILNTDYWMKVANITYPKKPKILLNLGYGSALGQRHGYIYGVMSGGPLIFGTRNAKSVGLVPEIVLDDIDIIKPDICFLFPYMYSIWKDFEDSKHPDWPRWKKAIKSRPKWCFATGGAAVDPLVQKWLRKELNVQLNIYYGSSEAGLCFSRNECTVDVPGEENYVTLCPGVEYYLEPLSEGNEDEGELFIRSSIVFTGYVDKAKEGDQNSYHGIIVDKLHDENFRVINGKEYYKINDIWKRSPKTGNLCYVSRVDDVLVFKTGVKMNPLPFESSMTVKCNTIKNCCLLVENKHQTEVILFIEPNWDRITGIDFSNENIKEKASEIAKEQVWTEVSNVLYSEMSSMANWVKQLSKNSIYIVEYGQTIPTTPKGNVSRRNCKIAFKPILDSFGNDNEINKEIDKLSRSSSVFNSANSLNNCRKEKNINDENMRSLNKSQLLLSTRDNLSSLLDLKKIYENERISHLINVIYSCISEIIPSTPPFNEFNDESTFSSYGFNSINSVKLIKMINSKLKANYSTVLLFNYNSPYELAKALCLNKTDSVTNLIEKTSESFESFNEIDSSSIPAISRPLCTPEKSNDSRIAIVGIGLRLPGGIDTTKKYWLSLLKGKNCLSSLPTDRELHKGYVNVSKTPGYTLGKEEHYISKYGYYDSVNSAAKPYEFDADFFECVHDEAVGMDVKQRWMLETSWEALEDAGIDPSTLENSNTGVFVGMNNCSHHVKLMASAVDAEHDFRYNPITLHGTELCSVAGRLSYFYKLYGPAVSIDTACSTGATALHTACRSIQYGECDLAIVSGARFLYYNDEFINTCHAKMTSPNGRCATFDEEADGFAPAEGCVTLILKKLKDVDEDMDNVYGIILGSSNGQSGGRQTISVPSSEAQVHNIKNALKNANVKPKDVSYIEAHGTGTPYGDALEIHALNQIFGHTHSKENPLYIGSVKTNLGHTCEAAGLTGVVKVLLSMQHRLIPKHINFRKLNPEINLDTIPLSIPSVRNIPWKSSDPTKPLIAQVSSFGLQGSLTNVVLQQYIPKNYSINNDINDDDEDENGEDVSNSNEEVTDDVQQNGNNYFLVTISAKNNTSLMNLVEEYISRLEEIEEEKNWKKKLNNFAYSSNLTRKHFGTRISAVGQNISEIIEELENGIDNLSTMPQVTNDKTKRFNLNSTNIIIYHGNENDFTPELIQSIKEIYKHYDYYKECFIHCEEKIQGLGGDEKYPMFDVIFSTEDVDINTLDPVIKRLILFSHFYSLHKLFLYFNIEINAIGGEGIGEFLSLAISSVLKLEETLRLLITYFNVKVEEEKIEKEIGKLVLAHKPLRCHFYSGITNKLNKNNQYLDEQYWKMLLSNTNIQDNGSDELEGLKIKQTVNVNAKTISVESSNLDEIPECNSYLKNIYYMIKKLYENGENINWKHFNHANINSQYKKVKLPFYQFQRSCFWPVEITK